LLSACAAGKPVVAICDADSELATVVQTNHCGVVVQPGDAQGLAQRLEQLSSDRQQLEPMGRAAKELGDRFLWSDVLEKFAREAEIVEEVESVPSPNIAPAEALGGEVLSFAFWVLGFASRR
jgi:glycosyltransferase involved in cell wall biosynthesis